MSLAADLAQIEQQFAADDRAGFAHGLRVIRKRDGRILFVGERIRLEIAAPVDPADLDALVESLEAWQDVLYRR